MRRLAQRTAAFYREMPFLAWLWGALAAALLESLWGASLAHGLGLPKMPVLFGFLIALKTPQYLPAALAYVLLIYAVPLSLVGRAAAPLANRLAAGMARLPLLVPAVVHLGFLYLALSIWSAQSDYRDLTVRLTLIMVVVTLSLNIINGYLGEFSCSHPGFMALGAYAASALDLAFFTDSKLFGAALLPPALGAFAFPLVLFLGGLVTAVAALIVAIPSFRTRGDYLAIISLAFTFIVKSLIENLEVVGGPRGMSGMPAHAGLPLVFVVTALAIWIINNFVTSILGKALCAVRDDELAAEAMSVDTRRTKIVAFMFAAFWAGVAGGLFAHVLRYVNPAISGSSSWPRCWPWSTSAGSTRSTAPSWGRSPSSFWARRSGPWKSSSGSSSRCF